MLFAPPSFFFSDSGRSGGDWFCSGHLNALRRHRELGWVAGANNLLQQLLDDHLFIRGPGDDGSVMAGCAAAGGNSGIEAESEGMAQRSDD